MFSFFKRRRKKELPESIKRLDIREGDTVVFTYPHLLSDEGRERLRGALEEVLWSQGLTVNVLILEDGLKIDVLLVGERKPVLEKEAGK